MASIAPRAGAVGAMLDCRSWSSDSGVIWKTALSEWSNATPVLVPGHAHVIVMNEPDEIVAIDTASGAVVWRDSTADLVGRLPKTHDANGWTTPTPVTDGSAIYAVFGSGVVAAYELDGQRRWARVLERPTRGWGHSASPLLAGGQLVVQIDDLVALNPATGAERWRRSSAARWGSPVSATIAGTDVVIAPAGDVFVAEDGRQLASGIGSPLLPG